MDGHEHLVKYLIGGGIVAVCLIAVTVIAVLEHHKSKYARSILVHVVQISLLFIAIGVGRQCADMAIEEFDWRILTPRMVDFMSITVIALVFMRQLTLLINRLEVTQVGKGRDPTSTRMVARVLKFAIFVIMLLFFGEHFGLSMSGLLAFGGIGGIAIGMAGKDILSNVFSGAMLYFDRQFNIGDWIRSPDRKIEGVVVEIGWRLTKIMTFDNRPLYVPNSLFSSISVENPGRMTNRHIQTEIGLRYEDASKVGLIVEDIRAMLKANADIDDSNEILVYFHEFSDSSLNIMVDCFTKTTRWAAWLTVQQAVYLKIIEIVQQRGADFAFPTQTLYMEKDAPAQP